MKPSSGQRIVVALGAALERIRPWHRLPRPLGLLCLMGMRIRLRLNNLYEPRTEREAPPPAGVAGRPFGRNQPLWDAPPTDDASILEPSPREVSRRLLARDGVTREVPFLNLLAAAWLQFQVHDWMSHGTGDAGDEIRIPLAEDDDWPGPAPGGDMIVRRTHPSDHGRRPGGPPVYDNTETHWWDGSQLYGSTAAREALVREGRGGRLRLDADGLLPIDEEAGVELAGVNGNWWLGLSLLHTVFAREHNAICAMLARRYPDWDDDRLFAVARRVNAAQMAKIHTIEWTPSILPHPTTRKAMHGNWYGALGPRASRLLRRVTRADVLIGIPGSRFDDHGVPYSLTEEFVAVYRMHPLIPDEFRFVSARTGEEVGRRTMAEVTGANARAVVDGFPTEDLVASFGVGRPGVLALHNYPDTLRNLPRSGRDGDGAPRRIDLAAIDIVRDRERGVPRYNDFRRMLRMRPAATFEELVGGDAAAAAELRAVYGDVERVDLMVGLYAEPLLPGFGFSETAFRIFVLMASRRLKSDRTFTDHYTPAYYTEEGLAWVERGTMAGVLGRNLPALFPIVDDLIDPFAPWDLPSNRRSGATAPLATAAAAA
ncbi:MAG: peroxidase family protein [Thermoleophilia bacterium]